MKAARDAHVLLSDSTLPINFCKCGPTIARKFAEYLGDRVYVVHDVYEELDRNPENIPALKDFLEEWPTTEVIQLAASVRGEVADILKSNITGGLHPKEDAGECATVFHARHVRNSEAIEYLILTDDQEGKRLARFEGLSVLDTPHLAIEMVVEGALSEDEGWAVWTKACRAPRGAYEDSLRDMRQPSP